MDAVTIEDLHAMIGRKDALIFQLQRHILQITERLEAVEAENVTLRADTASHERTPE